MRRLAAPVVAFVLLVATTAGSAAAARRQPATAAYVRLNQVGYASGEPKRALLMADRKLPGAAFEVVDSAGAVSYRAAVGARLGQWSKKFAYIYLLDFSPLARAGSYSIRVDGLELASAPGFRVDSAANLYGGLLNNARFFYQAQRDGPDVNPAVLGRQPSHLADRHADAYAPPSYDADGALVGKLARVGGSLDASGGWFDAGDYVKFVQTASYVDALMLFGVRQYPGLLSGGAADFAAESRFGLDWLQKMWDADSRTLYYQVGIGDGNGDTILGDHDLWRLPQADDQLDVRPGDPAYYVKHRPALRAGPPGAPISPNLAGRLAAALGLCYQVYHASDPGYAARCLIGGQRVFELADTRPGQLRTVSPFDFYPESEWRDDMELGAAELYFATAAAQPALPAGLTQRDPMHYLRAAAHWAREYNAQPDRDATGINLYDVGGLAHYELYNALAQAGPAGDLEISGGALLADMRAQLGQAAAQAAGDPFGYGIAYGEFDAAAGALGLAVEANLYDRLAGGDAFAALGRAQRDWALGGNAWGASFVIGAGSAFPQCPQHQIANLAGALDGSAPILLGGVVGGPNGADVFKGLGAQDGMRGCPRGKDDPYKQFSGRGARFVDNVIAWPSAEPAIDYTAASIILFAQQIAP